MMHLLVNCITLYVRLEDKIGEDIGTAIRLCQGDCLSTLLLILHLAYAIKLLLTNTQLEEYQ